MGGRRDFVAHALELLVDFVGVFVRLLVILQRNAQKKEEDERPDAAECRGNRELLRAFSSFSRPARTVAMDTRTRARTVARAHVLPSVFLSPTFTLIHQAGGRCRDRRHSLA